ncbi:hypothetical protein LTR78_002068 [Recurvomyces mirabilis]|uniref:Uncharacterized protein n=1 Tax=Recurvomyces mirabilis TaxID=574656 RepID=A0AAE1C4S6_9PEZI|nr:hypothetical protein LTR78_002068 [Recurvomyces mirabilis]KAK5160526.1 hypothetical protein LTS14_001538 [Recurvomyces mirabilis]
MHIEQKNLEQKNYELNNDIKLKSKNHEQLSKLYQSLKRQQMAPSLELAAEHDAEHVLHTANAAGQRNGQAMHSRGSAGSGGSGGYSRTIQAWEQQGRGARPALQTSHSVPAGAVPSTPSGMRHRMPSIYTNNGNAMKNVIERETYHPATPRHHAINANDTNGLRSVSGYGMSAGMRMGRGQQGPISRSDLMR